MCDIDMVLSLKPLSADFLEKRGKCCQNKCKNCPYYPKHKGGKELLKDVEVCAIPCSKSTMINGLCECLKI